MRAVRITYDPEGDILYVTFGQPQPSTGYQLSDQILLRVNPETQKASGLTIFNYSNHASVPGDIPMPGIEQLRDVKPLLLSILGSAPVNQFLRVSTGKKGAIATLLSPSLPEAVAG
jgi:uncharacterized protein YuzE